MVITARDTVREDCRGFFASPQLPTQGNEMLFGGYECIFQQLCLTSMG